MNPRTAYQSIVLAMNNLHDKKDKFLKRIHKKSKRYRYFRVPEYECFLINDIKFIYLYARDVVHGKLPEIMHNKMICESLCDPENTYIKSYFKICKGIFPIVEGNKNNPWRISEIWP